MRLLIAACVLAACDRGSSLDAVEVSTVELPAVAPVQPTVPPAPTKPVPPRAPLGKPTHIQERDSETLCLRDDAGNERCRKLTMNFRGEPVVAVDAPPIEPYALTRGTTACTLLDRSLVCGAEPPTPVTEHRGGYYNYLEGRDQVHWFEPSSTGTPALHTMAPLPGGIVQLEVGFRIGCARTGNAEVWCWSDPQQPRKVATPPGVAEIVLQDPFELCVRTDAGELHCTPPFTQKEALFCSKHGLACGTGEIERRDLKTSFDPLAKVMQPLRRVALPHRTADVDRDEDPIYQYCMDALFVGATNAGACALGPNGAVSCFSVCGGRWRTGTVANLPTTVKRVWSEGATGYALAADGELWWWPRARDCEAKASATAARVPNLPPIADLATPLSLRSGPQTWQPLRCALATTGEVRCWQPDETTGAPSKLFDPMVTPRVDHSRPRGRTPDAGN